MMRTISVSTEVFAKIWSLRKEGEETEDATLSRILGCNGRSSTAPSRTMHPMSDSKGFYDRQFDVHFPEGFEIFRNYLGTDYEARSVSGQWVLARTGRTFNSLNELSRAIGAKTENAWVNWFFIKNGERRPVSELRDPSKIRPRRRTVAPAKLISAEDL